MVDYFFGMKITFSPITATTALLLFSLSSCGTFKQRYELSTDGNQAAADDPLTGTWGLTRTLVRATALTAVKKPITSARTGAAMAWHRPTEIIRGNLPDWFVAEPLEGARPGGAAFERLLDEEGMTPEWEGSLSTLVDGREFFPAFEKAIAQAEDQISMQVFIFDNDDIAVRYGNLLRERARDVRVRVLFDDLGTSMATRVAPKTLPPEGFSPPGDMKKFLSKGSPLKARRTLNPWLLADHTKLITIDDNLALMGGMNMGREYYSEWHDLMVAVKGPVIASLQHHFDDSWRRAGPLGDFAKNPKAPALVPAPEVSEGVRILKTEIARGDLGVLKALTLAIRASQRKIWIETPYLSSDELKRELGAAAERGVDVRLILPNPSNSGVMNIANFAAGADLIEQGVKVYLYPGMTHLKAIVCDDWACVGSANLDTLSVRVNRELNLATGEKAFVKEMENRVFRPDFKKARRMNQNDVAKTESNPLAPLAEAIADQL